MPDGDLLKYLRNNPKADRLQLVDVPTSCFFCSHPHHKLLGLTEGLNYLHSSNVIHGDLKGVRGCSKSRLTILTSN